MLLEQCCVMAKASKKATLFHFSLFLTLTVVRKQIPASIKGNNLYRMDSERS